MEMLSNHKNPIKMKKINKTTMILPLIILAVLSFSSCNNSNRKNYHEKGEDVNVPSSQVTNNSVNELPNQTPSVEEVNQTNPAERFVGRYSILGDLEHYVFEILSDGRVLHRNEVSGHTTYVGVINVISDCAFKIVPADYDFWFGPGDCEMPYFRTHSEKQAGRAHGPYIRRLIFDKCENRAYECGIDEYESRDIASVIYYKFTH